MTLGIKGTQSSDQYLKTSKLEQDILFHVCYLQYISHFNYKNLLLEQERKTQDLSKKKCINN